MRRLRAHPALARRRAPAFTLLEVMVAIVLGSLVALMAYGSWQVSVDARVRLAGALDAAQRTRAARAMLEDAVRNGRAPRSPDDTTMVLHGGRLTFLSAGSGPPFDPEHDWRITIEPDAAGLTMRGVPIGRAPAMLVVLQLPGITRWDIRLLARGDSAWVTEWPAVAGEQRLPEAVEITLWNGAERLDPPLRVAFPTSDPSAPR